MSLYHRFKVYWDGTGDEGLEHPEGYMEQPEFLNVGDVVRTRDGWYYRITICHPHNCYTAVASDRDELFLFTRDYLELVAHAIPEEPYDHEEDTAIEDHDKIIQTQPVPGYPGRVEMTPQSKEDMRRILFAGGEKTDRGDAHTPADIQDMVRTATGYEVMERARRLVGAEPFTHDVPDVAPATLGAMRDFASGATRNIDTDSHDFEGFLSPLVVARFAEYMHKNRTQADGNVRDSDNWQKGIPLDSYMKSGWRHFFDWWCNHRKAPARDDLETALCALLFNVQGYLHETLRARQATEKYEDG